MRAVFFSRRDGCECGCEIGERLQMRILLLQCDALKRYLGAGICIPYGILILFLMHLVFSCDVCLMPTCVFGAFGNLRA